MAQLPDALSEKLVQLGDMPSKDIELFKDMLDRRIVTIMTDVETQLEKVFALQEAGVEIELELQRRRGHKR